MLKSNIVSTFIVAMTLSCAIILSGCSTNPATGEQQFTALMSPAQEQRIGAEQHLEVQKQFKLGGVSPAVQRYVESVGAKVAANTERNDVQYKFYVIDSSIVNAFALPGGYVYISRGILAQANSEAELAAVLAHEIGHITGRHSAERYSTGAVTSLGAMILSTAIDSSGASQALGLGTNLYLSSYSRGQEHQADELGIRYLARAGYDPMAMSYFMESLAASSSLENKIAGRADQMSGVQGYFSTHPQTADRVSRTVSLAGQYPKGRDVMNREGYFDVIDGVTYGESSREGFIRGNDFYHPEMNFTFSVPNGFKIINTPAQVVATHPNGSAIVFEGDNNPQNLNAQAYLTQNWLRNESLQNVERITINGKDAATGTFQGRVNNKPMTIQVVAINFAPNQIFRFQVAIPNGISQGQLNDLKASTYSLRTMTAQEKRNVRPYKIDIVTARSTNVGSLSRMMSYNDFRDERFRVLNGLRTSDRLVVGREYKIIVE